jgi:hypothetical protein
MSDSDDELDKANEERRTKLVKAGVAVGIGSAAIVAALHKASNVKKMNKRRASSLGVFGVHLRPYHSSSRIS